MPELSPTILIAALAFLLSAAVALRQRNRDNKLDQSKDITALLESVRVIDGKLDAQGRELSHLQGTSEATWRILEVYTGKTLHRHGDELGIDYYLDKDELTPDEAQEFVNRLAKIADDRDVADGTKMAATIKLAAVMRRYLNYGLRVPGL